MMRDFNAKTNKYIREKKINQNQNKQTGMNDRANFIVNYLLKKQNFL